MSRNCSSRSSLLLKLPSGETPTLAGAADVLKTTTLPLNLAISGWILERTTGWPQMPHSESSAGAGFQVSLEFGGLLAGSESDVGLEIPGPIFRCVENSAFIVFC